MRSCDLEKADKHARKPPPKNEKLFVHETHVMNGIEITHFPPDHPQAARQSGFPSILSKRMQNENP